MVVIEMNGKFKITTKIRPEMGLNGDPAMFRKLQLKRPAVVREGLKVKTCFYYDGTKQCLGSMCLWPKVGVCPIYNRLLKSKISFKAK